MKSDKTAKAMAERAARIAVKDVLDLFDLAFKRCEKLDERFKELIDRCEGIINNSNALTAQLNRVIQNAIVDGISRGVDKSLDSRFRVPQPMSEMNSHA